MTDGGTLQRRCPNCGADLGAAAAPHGPDAPRTTCRYCGQVVELPRPAPPRRIDEPPPRPPRGGPRVSAQAHGLVALLVVCIAAVFLSRRAPNGTLEFPRMTVPLAKAVPQYTWDTVGGPPEPAGLGPGGGERFVGQVQARDGGALWIAAFDGPKVAEAWRAGPFGTPSQGDGSTFVAVVGRAVVVTDFRAVVHVLDLANGHELRSVTLTDRAKSMCASPDGAARVWIQVADEKNVALDVDTASTSAAARPAWCPEGPLFPTDDCRGYFRRGRPRAQCKGSSGAPAVSGFRAELVVQEGADAVALGEKHPGTAIPMVVGFDPATKAVRWQGALAAADPVTVAESHGLARMDVLTAGRFVAPYEVTPSGWRLTALDARSGQRLWDVPLQPLKGIEYPEGFSLSAARVYMMRTGSLEVYDAKTGALVGIIGR
jgi:hypothetical protein